MRRTTILNSSEVKQTTFEEAQTSFLKHCRLRNLRPQTIRYYTEDLTYFHANVPLRFVGQITQEVFDNFIFQQLEQGKKVSSLNTRIRGLRVFFKFCAEQEYMKPISPKLMKADEEIKEPCYDMYVAEFEYDGIEYQIVAEQIEAEEVVKVVSSIIYGEEVFVDK